MNDPKDNIVLIGFMGSGKTTVGKWISEHTGKVFYDTDACIEEKQQKKIKDIFASEGEEYFRELETEMIKALCETAKDAVISAGGGLPIKQKNRELLKKLGRVVYLKTSEENLVQRLGSDINRPLLFGTDIQKKVRELMTQRAGIYEETAEVIVDTDGRTPEQIYCAIKNTIIENNYQKEG